ncbi:MAG: tRNA (adenosine(37)-N6)-dimethylallyltransferase MiaA [Cyclobacteriaceae bacterium]|nr:tRNA (adenosine(37)-N6)-dimethylallyltransferase MiaA [Cyclobacteriaceae bacterium]
MMEINLITITGPTASGKTAFAAQLARLVNGEIISADSRQVYRGMNLGTGKDYEDYMVDGVAVPYHLIDIKPAGYKYNVFEFQQDFTAVFNQIKARARMPLLVGGTGLYIEAVTNNYNLKRVPANDALRKKLEEQTLEELIAKLKKLKPELHNTTDTTSKKRTIRAIEIALYEGEIDESARDIQPINNIIFGMSINRDVRRERISARLKARLECGMIEEVRTLLETVPADDLIFYGLEYKYITQHLLGQISYKEMYNQLEIAIHQFAKRQMTWFRKMERDGIKIHWIDAQRSMSDKISEAVHVLDEAGFRLHSTT